MHLLNVFVFVLVLTTITITQLNINICIADNTKVQAQLALQPRAKVFGFEIFLSHFGYTENFSRAVLYVHTYL